MWSVSECSSDGWLLRLARPLGKGQQISPDFNRTGAFQAKQRQWRIQRGRPPLPLRSESQKHSFIHSFIHYSIHLLTHLFFRLSSCKL